MLSGLAYAPGAFQAHRTDFRFSQGRFAEDQILDSCMSMPGRYLLEVGRRALAAHPDADRLVIANPLLPLNAARLDQIVAATGLSGIGIVTDDGRFPVLYSLPRRLFEELPRFTLLLSAIDAKLDSRLLGLVLKTRVSRRRLPDCHGLRPSRANGWLNSDARLYSGVLTCKEAIRAIETNPDWRNLPLAVHYPNHAGDVLFFCVASKRAEHSLYRKQVVCTCYRDIPGACGSRLETLPLHLPWIARDNTMSELDYFHHSLNKLGPEVMAENYVVFARLTRPYYLTPFHMVDHATFALGDPMDRYERTMHAWRDAPERRCELPIDQPRVLFHLNGGWPLKNLQPDVFRQVARTLIGLGWQVSIIDRPDLEDCGAKSIDAVEADSLRRAVEDHHIYVGVDSFPHHFVRTVMGWPTIGLFATTKPCNSDAAYGEAYRTSCRNLPCSRCGGNDVCPVFLRGDCQNFVKADRVVTDILEMAAAVYGAGA